MYAYIQYPAAESNGNITVTNSFLPRKQPSTAIFSCLNGSTSDMSKDGRSSNTDYSLLECVELMKIAVTKLITATLSCIRTTSTRQIARNHMYALAMKHTLTTHNTPHSRPNHPKILRRKCKTNSKLLPAYRIG